MHPSTATFWLFPFLSWRSVPDCLPEWLSRLRPHPHSSCPAVGSSLSLFIPPAKLQILSLHVKPHMLNAALVFLLASVHSSDLLGFNSMHCVAQFFLSAFRRHLSTDIIHPTSHFPLDAGQRLILTDERLKVLIFSDGPSLLVTPLDGAACLIASFTLKVLDIIAAHVASQGCHPARVR